MYAVVCRHRVSLFLRLFPYSVPLPVGGFTVEIPNHSGPYPLHTAQLQGKTPHRDEKYILTVSLICSREGMLLSITGVID